MTDFYHVVAQFVGTAQRRETDLIALGKQRQTLSGAYDMLTRAVGNLARVTQPGDVSAWRRVFMEELPHSAMYG
ncbi:hypothetical protein, partial [Leclercia adecarboxylata]